MGPPPPSATFPQHATRLLAAVVGSFGIVTFGYIGQTDLNLSPWALAVGIGAALVVLVWDTAGGSNAVHPLIDALCRGVLLGLVMGQAFATWDDTRNLTRDDVYYGLLVAFATFFVLVSVVPVAKAVRN